MEKEITLRELLAAGVHFGHQRARWNPKMQQYIFTERSGIHIIDLEKTVSQLSQAVDYLKDVASGNGTVLFVGTKKQSADLVADEARKCGMPYVTYRWQGGMLTNFATIKKQISKLEKFLTYIESDDFQKLTKKDKARIEDEIEALEKNVGGLKNMKKLPSAVFIIDTHKEKNAVKEAAALKIPIIGIADTNANPDLLIIPIPANDDSVASLKLILSFITEAIAEGRQEMRVSMQQELESEQAAEQEVNLMSEALAREDESMVIEEKNLSDKEKDAGKKRTVKVGKDIES